jgi:hypothetical protein
MSATSFPDPIRAAARNAFPVEPAQLNSERIRERFGNCGIEILAETDSLRRANLFSIHGGVQTCRTYALVRALDAPPEITTEHTAIVGGQSIGATFRAGGWTVAKKTLLTGKLAHSDVEPQVSALMRLTEARPVALHAYELLVEREASRIRYALILELHHPDYLREEELSSLFPTPVDSPIDRHSLAQFLRHFNILL